MNRFRIPLTLILISFASQVHAEESKLFRGLGVALYVTNATDLISTEYALTRNDGLYEANPLLSHRWVRIPLKTAMPFVVNTMTAKVYKTHPRVATVIRLASVVGYGYIATRNIQLVYTVRF